ncbi:hypothetical protein UMZ34_08465 [Halopseudomonas pachastrellae]|nr:hypothetical protein UMZ34_08465 [Halopseudomonas pachastrellae]
MLGFFILTSWAGFVVLSKLRASFQKTWILAESPVFSGPWRGNNAAASNPLEYLTNAPLAFGAA